MLERQTFLSRTSIFEIRQRIRRLECADLDKLSPEQLRQRIGRIIDDYPFQIRSLDLSGIYRARKNLSGAEFTKASELWYPPASVVSAGRLNGAGQVRLYAASMPNTTLLELKPCPGDVFTILVARTHNQAIERIGNVAFIGIERSLAPERAALTENDIFRTSPSFRANMGEGAYRKWLLVDDYVSGILGEKIDQTNELKYKLTGVFGDLFFQIPKLNAITYPSVATNNYGVNICLTPERADALFRPSEAWEVRVGPQESHPDVEEAPLYAITFLRRSREIQADGAINWLPPGVGLDPESVASFVRHRLHTLPTRPQPLETPSA